MLGQPPPPASTAALAAASASEVQAPVLPDGLATPCLVIDVGLVEANARRMADALAARGIDLRPHVKTHKSIRLAEIQLAAGAVGISVGTLGEAEVMADGGVSDIFIAYPLWADAGRAERLRTLLGRPDLRLAVGVDSATGAERLGRAAVGAGRALRVLVEVDPGNRRTGVAPAEVVDVARVAQRAGLELAGIFSHGGHAYHGRDKVQTAAADEVTALAEAAAELRRAGMAPSVVSAGSSPTALAAATSPVTEMRPGTYLLNDRQQVALGAASGEWVAIAVAATVVSASVPGQVVIDAGAKSLTKDLPAYLDGYGQLPAYPGAVVERVSDYHGVVRLARGSAPPPLGEVVAVVPNHACPVVDLYDSFIATRAGRQLGRWPVDARGRSG